jgi:methionyl-tRNA formyltransferase
MEKAPMRIIFAGTPEFALPPLQTLIDGEYEISAVLTQPDRPAGRGKKLRASPVKQLAVEYGLNVLQPDTLRDEAWQQKLAALQADLMVVVAYGLMIPASLLATPRFGCWNIHASLLPRWRGAAPIQRAIEAGDEHTGVCIMQMEVTLDTGPVYHCLETAIGSQDTAGSLHDRLAGLGAKALRHCLELSAENQLPEPLAQDHSNTVYAGKLSKAEAELDWSKPAEVLQREVRAFNPWPVSWCDFGGQRLRVWRAEVIENTAGLGAGDVFEDNTDIVVGTADKALKILEIQRAGGQRVSTGEFLNAHRLISD